MSESSYASTHEEIVPQAEKTTKATQVDFAPFHYQFEKCPGKLHRNHTSSELLIASQKNSGPYLRTSTLNRPKFRYDSNLTRPDSLHVLQSRSDSGYGTYSTAKVRSKTSYGDSPTLSLTPPNSQDYLYPKSDLGSSVPSILSNGMNASKANGGLYLNPNYLQPYATKYNQSSTELQVVIGGSRLGGPSSGASSCHCSCRGVEVEVPAQAGSGSNAAGNGSAATTAAAAMANRTTAEGLSWRRLHMSRAKLKATATTSELLSGFAMVAMVELQINEPTNVPEWLFVMFAVCTTVLVAVHIFALMISTYLLPTIDAVSKMGDGQYPDGSSNGLHVIRESPHERMRGFIELAWAFSTVLGLFLFLVEIAILCWVKFWDYSFAAATAATVIVIPVLIVFVAFAVHFYHSLVVHKCDTSEEDMEQLESMKRNLDTATIHANSPV